MLKLTAMTRLKNVVACFFILSTGFRGIAQYTETINSNRPGTSQGAFSVGNSVLQLEAGVDQGNDNHRLLLTDSDIFGVDASLRYGLLIEQLEINGNFRYQVNQVSATIGNTTDEELKGLETAQIGAKFLVYDPYKYQTDEVNLYSYHANHRFKWKTLIPAVAISASAVFDFTTNPFLPIIEDGVSPNLALITQHNWGRWVWVNNIIGDRVTTNFPSYSWVTTMTHSFSPKASAFIEFQLIDGDLYSDQIGRLGGAYLVTRDFQLDISGLFNFKDTPLRWNVGLGASYRLDFHYKDEKLKIKEKGKDKEDEKNKDGKGEKSS